VLATSVSGIAFATDSAVSAVVSDASRTDSAASFDAERTLSVTSRSAGSIRSRALATCALAVGSFGCNFFHASAARPSKIVVVSIPAGAHVVVDGAPRCTTPCTLKLHPMEPVLLEVKRPGYSPWRRELHVELLATNIIDARKAQDFYSKVLGGDYPPLDARPSAPQVMLNGWFPQATTNNNVRIELGLFAVNEGKIPPPIKFQDINANYAGFQVSNIESVYARAKMNGAITVSDGGIVDFQKGKAVLIRDSDVGGYIMLWQPPR